MSSASGGLSKASAEQDVLAREAARAETGIAWLRLVLLAAIAGIDTVLYSGWVPTPMEVPPGVLALDYGGVLVALGALLILRRLERISDRVRFLVLSVDLSMVVIYSLAIAATGEITADMTAGMAASIYSLMLLISVLRFSVPTSVFGAVVATVCTAFIGHAVGARHDLLGPIVFTTAVTGGFSAFVAWRHRRAIHHAVERRRLERFLPREVVDEVVGGPEGLGLGGRETVVTVLFSDLAGFTTMSESMKPQEVMDMLNDYLSVMVEVVFRHLGTVDKFVGDAVMAVFGAPVRREDDALRALRCALAMKEALGEVNRRRQERGQAPLSSGVGLHTGPVVAGTLGSLRRMEYTVIGDTVNVAARVEGLTRKFGEDVLITRSTADLVGDEFKVRRVGEVQVKGRVQPVEVFAVDGPAR